jgi:hypothetical protein
MRRGARRDATFENVLKKPLVFPDTPAVSAECKDLIAQLLHKVGGWRLRRGGGGGGGWGGQRRRHKASGECLRKGHALASRHAHAPPPLTLAPPLAHPINQFAGARQAAGGAGGR